MAHNKFAGKCGEARRVFVLSADTFKLEGDNPWWQLTEKDFEAVMKFMLGQIGPFDILESEQ